MIKRITAVFVIGLTLAGCATRYYAGEFTALDSRGEEQQFLVEWKKTDAWLWGDKADPVALHMLGGVRVVMFNDRKGVPLAACVPALGKAILFCGEPNKDLLPDGTRLPEPSTCGWLATDDGAERIVDLGNELEVTIQCRARRPAQVIAGVPIISDYLAARDQPYDIQVNSMNKSAYASLKARYKKTQ